MRKVVLESPYSGDVEGNIAYAKRCIHDCLVRGESPVASHLLFAQPSILDDAVPAERWLGIAAGLEWQEVADAVVFYCDRGWSQGMMQARARAQTLGKPIEERYLGRP